MAVDWQKVLPQCKLKSEPLNVPQFGCEGAVITELTSAEKIALNRANFPPRPDGARPMREDGYDARWIIAAVRDAAGKPLFEAKDAALIDQLPCTLVEPLADRIRKLNLAGSGAVEAEAKNS